MTAVPKKKLTVAEYLAIERTAEFKSEFYNGEMFAMAGASRQHNELKENLIGELFNRLKGGPCNDHGCALNRSCAKRFQLPGWFSPIGPRAWPIGGSASCADRP